MILFSASLMLFLIGKMLMDAPPGNINKFSGYRTKKSMLNQENWNLAQIISSKYLYKSNIFMLMSSIPFLIVDVIFLFVISNEVAFTISIFIQGGIVVINFIGLFYFTEKALKENTNERPNTRT